MVRRHSFQANRGALQRVASTKGVTGTAVITMKACRASIEVLSPRPEPMRSSVEQGLPLQTRQHGDPTEGSA